MPGASAIVSATDIRSLALTCRRPGFSSLLIAPDRRLRRESRADRPGRQILRREQVRIVRDDSPAEARERRWRADSHLKAGLGVETSSDDPVVTGTVRADAVITTGRDRRVLVDPDGVESGGLVRVVPRDRWRPSGRQGRQDPWGLRDRSDSTRAQFRSCRSPSGSRPGCRRSASDVRVLWAEEWLAAGCPYEAAPNRLGARPAARRRSQSRVGMASWKMGSVGRRS